ncbi:MAG: hypothetical protein JRG81_00015 [Deltaproteobacteria bacterium]|nr:hypothetical protein [Deltaproteobacteria bacterium]MBW2363462.1 hypothetical protein [Deltaproteobacteria bacterium]
MPKLITICILCIFFSSCATFNPDPWTKDQIIMQGVLSSLNIVDWGQTLDIADRPDEYREINPILGDHPDRGDVNIYFASTMILKVLVTHLLPTEYREYWLGGNIALSGYFVHHNHRIGLRVNF